MGVLWKSTAVLVTLLLFGFGEGLAEVEKTEAANDPAENRICSEIEIDTSPLPEEKAKIDEQLDGLVICHQSGPGSTALKILEQNFRLDETSSPEDYKATGKTLKKAAKGSSGTTQIYVPGFGSVPASVQSVRTGPSNPGDAQAQFLLGYIYLNGLTGKVKASKAKRWLERAASQGHFQARQMLEEIENKD